MDGSTDARGDDNGPFGRPLFEDSSARDLSRVGVVDIGSNSVRFVVFDGAARSPAYFYNEKVMAGLGEGLVKSGRLNPVGRERALAALKRFALLARGMKIEPLTCVATAAVREATDGPEFRALAERETGLKLWVIDGQEEARLSAQGVLLGWPEANGLVCDIGGNSMELAEVSDGTIGRRITSPLGPFRLQEVKGGQKTLEKHIRETMRGLAADIGTHHDRIYLVGGSWRAIARIDMERRKYPMTVLHEYRMAPEDVAATADYISRTDVPALRAMTGIGQERMALVPLASLVLRELAATFTPKEIDVSSYGIREGLLYEQMPDKLRKRDPLIEACRYAEHTMARMPGFGKKLYAFILPLFADAPPKMQRLIRAACLLHDTTWRAHPDYRAEVCFDNATRGNLGGISHPERVFLGLSLLHRYKNSRAGSRFEPLFSLLQPEQIDLAEVLGKAMRFGAMFALQSPLEAGTLGWNLAERRLDLQLEPGMEPLFGEVARARFLSLAGSLRAETRVTVRPGAADL